MQAVVDGVLTHYELVNPEATRPVVILHGWGSNSSYWLPLTKLLTENHQYYLLDLPGFGDTKPLQANANVSDYSNFVHSFLLKLKLKNITLVGHSFGGQIASDYSLKYPSGLQHLVLIDSATVRTRTLTTKLKILLAKTVKPITRLLPVNLSNRFLSLYAPPEYVSANSYLRSTLHQILKYDLSNRLHLIKVPTDIVWGSEDHVIPYVGKLLVETIPNSKLHLIYGAGHLPHLTHTKKLADLLNKVLA